MINLPNKTSLDILGIDNFLLKVAASAIYEHLTYLFNLSLSSCHVPLDWKRALVTPIYKNKGSKEDKTNYRPISITSTIIKILESALKFQITNFFEKSSVICANQSAYLHGRSTQTALHSIINDLSSNLNDGYVSLVCTLDMAKGFDTIPHDILLYKLKHYNFSPASINWFKSYLSDRSQIVKCNSEVSEEKPVNIGVPQGSILGPLLFILYTNDLPSVLKNCKCEKYADDTTLYCKAKTVAEAEQILQDNLNLLENWFHTNRLPVNASKCSVMIIKNRNNHNMYNVNITLNNVPLLVENEVKLLGVIIDECLSWKSHISYISSKMAPKLGLLYRISKYVPFKQLCMIYNAIIQSLMDYCITIWASTYKTNINIINVYKIDALALFVEFSIIIFHHPLY